MLDRAAPGTEPPRPGVWLGLRVHRGGGLGREAVYLPALLRVEAAVADDSGIDAVLGKGRVSVAAAPTLRAWVASWALAFLQVVSIANARALLD